MKSAIKIALVLVLFGFLILRPTPSFADHHWHTYVGVNFGYPNYYDYDDPFWEPYPYHPYYPPYNYYPPAYAVSTSNYEPVVVNGTTYYVNNGVYYLYTQYGYQAVPTPAGASSGQVTVSTSSTDENTITVNIPNSKGGYTPVVLKKSGSGYTGPQGEYYAEFPAVSQLKTMYGK